MFFVYINDGNDTTLMNYYTSKLDYYLQIIENSKSKRFKLRNACISIKRSKRFKSDKLLYFMHFKCFF